MARRSAEDTRKSFLNQKYNRNYLRPDDARYVLEVTALKEYKTRKGMTMMTLEAKVIGVHPDSSPGAHAVNEEIAYSISHDGTADKTKFYDQDSNALLAALSGMTVAELAGVVADDSTIDAYLEWRDAACPEDTATPSTTVGSVLNVTVTPKEKNPKFGFYVWSAEKLTAPLA